MSDPEHYTCSEEVMRLRDRITELEEQQRQRDILISEVATVRAVQESRIAELEARLDAAKNCKTYICEFPDIGKIGPAYRQRDIWEALEQK